MIIVVSDGAKSYQKELSREEEKSLYGRKIGEEIPGEIIGLLGYTLKITGGSDKDGFPMRKDIEGISRRKILIRKGETGCKEGRKGERIRKSVRGNIISEFIAQVNMVVVKKGEKPLEELMPKKEEKK